MHSMCPIDRANKADQKQQEQVMSKCERKVVRKFALETKKLMHSPCPTDRANNPLLQGESPPKTDSIPSSARTLCFPPTQGNSTYIKLTTVTPRWWRCTIVK